MGVCTCVKITEDDKKYLETERDLDNNHISLLKTLLICSQHEHFFT